MTTTMTTTTAAPAPSTMAAQAVASYAATSNNVAGPRQEVMCPLSNADGTNCRKKCSGIFAYRSICEHIRRAHPENFIPRLPASLESFRKMVQTVPGHNSGTGIAPGGVSGGATIIAGHGPSRKSSSGGVGPKPRVKVQPRKSMTHGEHGEELSPSSSAPESETLLSMPTNRAYSDAIYDNGYDITRSGPIIETDTESDGTYSPASPPSARATHAHPPAPRKAIKSTKSTTSVGISRKKSSILTKSPRKDRRRSEKGGPGKSNNASSYVTPVMSSSDLKSMAHGPDMMDLDDQNLKDRDDYELDSDELGHLFTSLSRPTYHGSTGHGGNAENCQIRRAFSFSVGDTGSMTVSQNKKSGLALNTNFVGGFGHEGGSMSAGGIGAERVNNGSRWNELLMAATEATELEKKESPPLCQPFSASRPNGNYSDYITSALCTHHNSRNPSVSSTTTTPRNPFGPDLPPSMVPVPPALASLFAATDMEEEYQRQKEQSASRNKDTVEDQQTRTFFQPFGNTNYYTNSQIYQTQPHNHTQYPQPFVSPSVNHHHHHIPYSNPVQEQKHQGSFAQSYPSSTAPTPAMAASNKSKMNHTNISPILLGTSLTSAANSPPFTSLNQMHNETVTPKIQCSSCHVVVDIMMSYACTECINGFCYQCASPDNGENVTEKERGANLKVEYSQETGKKNTGYESRGKDGHGPTATAKTTCGVCGVQGAIFKKVRINVVVR